MSYLALPASVAAGLSTSCPTGWSRFSNGGERIFPAKRGVLGAHGVPLQVGAMWQRDQNFDIQSDALTYFAT